VLFADKLSRQNGTRSTILLYRDVRAKRQFALAWLFMKCNPHSYFGRKRKQNERGFFEQESTLADLQIVMIRSRAPHCRYAAAESFYQRASTRPTTPVNAMVWLAFVNTRFCTAWMNSAVSITLNQYDDS
jgi:hypothetical protein